MRKASTLVGLTLVALAATARAQDPAPAAAPAAPAAAPAPAPPPVQAAPAPAPAPAAAVPAPAPAVVLPAEPPAGARRRRLEIGLSFLQMGLGKFSAAPGGMPFTADAAFAYGLGFQVGYLVVRGLSVGIAPQIVLNVKPKEEGSAGAKEIDLMPRIAYAFRPVETIALYLELLPGYSFIRPPDGDISKGLVLGVGGGAAVDLSARVFAILGVSRQVGYQRLPARDMSAEAKTSYVRLALGVGARF